MIDREKVIKGLECCSKGCSGDCTYSVEGGDCCTVLAADALKLLKAQEPVKPETQRDSEWISVKERLPDERETIFAKLYGTDKWRPQMFRKVSDDVRVVCVFEDGTRRVWHDTTKDGKWASERPGNYPVRHIAYWMENPELPKGDEV